MVTKSTNASIEEFTTSQAAIAPQIKIINNHSDESILKANPHSVTKAQVGLGNVDNKSEATIKSDFTGSIANNDTGFVTGGAVHTALANKLDTPGGLTVSGGGSSFYWNTGTDIVKGCYFRETASDSSYAFIGVDNNELGGSVYLSSSYGIAINGHNGDNLSTAILRTTNLDDTRIIELTNRDGTIALAPTVGTTQPSSAVAGDIWIDTN